MTDLSRIRAVVFDAYGTVIDFHNVEFRAAIAELLGNQRIDLNSEEFYEGWVKLYGKASPWAGSFREGDPANRERMLAGPLPEWHSTWDIWRRQFALAFEQFGVEGDADAAADHLRALLSHAPPYADARETLERLDRAGYRLALLSNADEDFLQSALSRGRLRFSAIQSSEALRAYKPHRAVFVAICARLGCEPEEVLYVGDSPYADVNGGHRAGLATAWVRRSEGEPYPEQVPAPDLEVHSLAHLADVLCDRPAIAGTRGLA
ncbi:MAG: HAD-IA family hydrolase [Chloroflexi bacterium]|nr:HAD-IA family hydrolase [Chloroflexota bacterium]MDA1004293.1 HAD-IA family hydrolase [Chloroflexota bacterium]MQC28128.1 HAD family hydrolase [Chloroflexota bacterium]